jgi:putative membrane-bound dehydrogenase-like protein
MTISRTLIASALLASAVAEAAEFKVNGKRFVVPDGFVVECVATSELVPHPVSASFDDKGRLYVTDSDGSNAKPDEQLKNPGARILRLDDSNGDGAFDKASVFADKVMFPQGCLWHDGSVYVAGPPSIWRFTDTKGSGVADRREEWFKGGSLTGCANDIHGPYLGPEGFIYWTKGAFAEQTHTLGNGRILKDKAAHIFRMKPDGTGLESIMSGGMDNPVEVAFTRDGETLFSSTFIDFTQPGFRDGIAHAVYGGAFGKINDVMDDGRVKRTGPELFHPFYQAGPAAECGLTRYESDAFGLGYRDNLFATTFNLHKVTRHVLRKEGASYASTDSDFLVCDDVDFHPTDVLPDADGSLLVVDTGGWYRLCCPSSQLAKPDVLGAIYRVRRADAPHAKAANPDYAKLTSGPTVEIPDQAGKFDNELWQSLSDPALWTSPALVAEMKKINADPELMHAARRVAADAGVTRKREVIPQILAAAGHTSDAFLTHGLIYALIEIADSGATRAGLTHGTDRTHRAALIALDQMDGSDLKPSEVVPHLTSADPGLKSAAEWIVGRHPEWGTDLAKWFREQLRKPAAPAQELARIHAQFAVLAGSKEGRLLLAESTVEPGFAGATRIAAFETMSNAGLKEVPASWTNSIRATLQKGAVMVTGNSGAGGKTPTLLASAVQAARIVQGDAVVQKSLVEIAEQAGLPDDLRLQAYAALPGGRSLAAADVSFLVSLLDPTRPPAIRSGAAGVLGKARLEASTRDVVVTALKTAGPLELTRLLAAFDSGGDEALGASLVAALRESKSARALHPTQIQPHFAKFPEATAKQLSEFLATLNADAAKQGARLEALLAELHALTPDVRRGQSVFNGTKASCSACHRIGYLGGNVGPELTKIGEARTERDLLESIVYPSASFVRSYEPSTLVLKDGEQVNGIIRRETADEYVVTVGPAADQHVRRSDVVETRPGTISVMPAGLEEQLSRQELADLLHFVKTVRWR